MGQAYSTDFEFLQEQLTKTNSITHLKEITFLTKEDLKVKLDELNTLSTAYSNCQFKIKDGSDTSSLFWKLNIRIIYTVDECANTATNTNTRQLNLKEFLQVYTTLQSHLNLNQTNLQSQSQSEEGQEMKLQSPSPKEECCICMDSKPEVSLPCAHSYCLACIEQWNVSHKTCPTCRETLQTTDETWVLESTPDLKDVEDEIEKSLRGLTR